MSNPTPTAPRRPATLQQGAVLKFVREYRGGHGYSPTMQEIADALGFSKVTAHEHVHALEHKGYLRVEKRSSRSIRVIGQACPACGHVTE